MKRKTVIFAISISTIALPFLLWGLFRAVGGYLARNYGSVRFESPLQEAHSRAVDTFVQSKGFGLSRLKHLSLWNDMAVDFEGETYQVRRIQLVAAIREYGEKVYLSATPPKKEDLQSAESRELSSEEWGVIIELRKGGGLGALIRMDAPSLDPQPGQLRVLAPLRLRSECLDCHEGDLGDLAGAFAYTLEPFR